jgi:hypothetical protein
LQGKEWVYKGLNLATLEEMKKEKELDEKMEREKKLTEAEEMEILKEEQQIEAKQIDLNKSIDNLKLQERSVEEYKTSVNQLADATMEKEIEINKREEQKNMEDEMKVMEAEYQLKLEQS